MEKKKFLTMNPNQDRREDKNHKRFHFKDFPNCCVLSSSVKILLYQLLLIEHIN